MPYYDPYEPQKKKKDIASVSSYALLLVISACVIFLATVFAITQTQKHIYTPERTAAPIIKNIIGELTQRDKPSVEEVKAIEDSMNYWPFEEFPSVPQYDALKYTTTLENRHATIAISAQEAGDLPEYIDSMLRAGAKLLVDTGNLAVVIQSGCEMHIFYTGTAPRIELCAEQEVQKPQGLPDLLMLPKNGRLVTATLNDTSETYTFVYRNAAVNDALSFLNDLIAADWQIVGRVSQTGNAFLAVYRKGGYELSVDYFTGGDYKIQFRKSQYISIN